VNQLQSSCLQSSPGIQNARHWLSGHLQ
jgi:hypothetical protein